MSAILLLAVLPILWLVLLPGLKFVGEYRRQKQIGASIPGPPGLPLIGSVFSIKRSAEDMPKNMIQRANEFAKNGHEISQVWFLHRCFITPFTGKAVKDLLDSSEEITKGNDYDLLLPWLGRGLLLNTGDSWRQRRRLLTPTFHFSQLDTYISAMNRHSKILVDDILHDKPLNTIFDLYPFIKLCTLDIICETAMGKELDAQHHPSQPYVTSVSRMAAMAVETLARPVLWSIWMRKLLGHDQEFMGHVKVARDFTHGVIEERRRALENGEVEQNKRAFLDMLLLQSGDERMSIEDLKDEVETFMFEGHDTTASGLAWSVWCLACNPEHQQRAAEEVKSIFGDDADREATREDLQSMPYLDRCIKESMRLFPPVPIVMRTMQNDFVTEGFTLPRGTSVNICPLALHRNEANFENAQAFDPDRFLPERSVNRHAFSYIPFSAGPRNCIGQRFASFEEKVVMSWLLRRYRFECEMSLHDNPPLAEAVLRPKYGCAVIMYPRT